MTFASVGGAILGGAASAVVGHVLGGSNSASQSGSPANTANPFAGQYGQYQPQLSSMVLNGNASQGGSTAYAGTEGTIAQEAGQGNSYQQQMSQLLNPNTSASALAQMPGYQFQLQQGTASIDRSAAASGMLGSGNEAAELEQYGQGLASTTFQQQFNNLQTASTNVQNNEAQEFGQLNTLDVNAANNYSNAYQQLAQLSGANTGNPGVAGQLQQSSNAATAGFIQQATGPLANAAANSIFGNGSSPTTAADYSTAAAVNNGLGASNVDLNAFPIDTSDI